MFYLLGIDAGTTSFKAVLFDEEGKEIAIGTEDYKLLTPSPTMVELEPENYWNTCKKVIRQVLDKSRVNPKDIKALTISSQGETLICLDREGNPLRRAIVWIDNRSDKEAEIIKEEFGIRRIFEITGQPEVVPTWPATKILWIRQNEPSLFKKVHKYLLLEDYLIYKFTGKFVAEKSLLSSTLFFDIREGKWWREMLNFIGISSNLLPEIRESGEIVGRLTDRASSETGLCRDTLVITGALDQAAGAIGAGNIAPGVITETTGGALAICATIDKPVFTSKIPCHYHAIKGKYYLLAWAQTAGMVLKWFRDNFCQLERENSKMRNLDVYDIMTQEASRIPPGSEGLIMLPHLSGSACPEFNPKAKGVFFGFTLKHTRAHFIRAILESIAFMLNKNIKALEGLGVQVGEIRSLGGGAKSRLWNAIKADVTGRPIITLKTEETACLGAAILAGVGVGMFNSIEEACHKMVSVRERISPNSKNREVYQKAYSRYLVLYDHLEDMFNPENIGKV